MEYSNFDANHVVGMNKTTGVVWNPWRLVFLLLITLFCMHKTTGEVWDP